MRVVYANQKAPDTFTKSIFLAGPTPRSEEVVSWRIEALNILREEGFDGVVFVPETEDGKWQHEYINQIEWEEKYLHMADCILFWVPRELSTMPAFTTNVEWGHWKASGKVVFGAPENAPKNRYLWYYADKLDVPRENKLRETARLALEFIGNGALRSYGEREVPLYIWNTHHFQGWYSAQKKAGNRLDGARMEWVFRVGPKKQTVFFWAMRVNVFVAAENRNKVNEVVISRTDISTILLYHRGRSADETLVVFIREFRSPARTSDGFVHELPGGSAPGGSVDGRELARTECFEETGFRIDKERLVQHASRQLAATMSTHKADFFSAEIDATELEKIRELSKVVHGESHGSERTHVEILKLSEVRKHPDIDWSTLGMIYSVLCD